MRRNYERGYFQWVKKGEWMEKQGFREKGLIRRKSDGDVNIEGYLEGGKLFRNNIFWESGGGV